MCGILAAYSQESFREEKVRQALESLKHRGPDEAGIEYSTNRLAVIGHTRLSLIDIEGGQQPFVSEGLIMAVNGELYNHEEIRHDLIAKGHVFKSRSDSEIALHLYRQYGVSFVEHLRGEFALTLWDESKQCLIAVRDRFGIKPLSFVHSQQGIFIASEAKALFKLGCIEPEWDENSYYAVASRQYLSPGKSLFRGVSQVPPGNLLVYERGQVSLRQYWDLDYPTGFSSTDERETIEEFRTLLEDSVSVRMKADLPVCFHLSGGLDSTSLAAIGSQRVKQLNCFTVSFEGENYDELEQAEETAMYLGANLHVVDVSARDIVENLEASVYFSEGLGINGHFAAKYLLNKRIKESGFSIALSGEGADELLAGYPHLRQDMYASDNFFVEELMQSNVASRGIMLAQGQSLNLQSLEEKLGFVPAFLKAKGSMGFKLHSLFEDDFLMRQSRRDCYGELLADFDFKTQLKGRSSLDQSSYLWIKTALSQYILRTLGDGCEMASSVEGRVPFLDHKLFEFCRRLPTDYKIRNKTEKYLLREAVKDIIPHSVYMRQKHPFMAPPLTEKAEIQVLIQDLVRSREFGSLPFFDRPKVLKALERLPAMTQIEKKAWDPVFFTLITSSFLQKNFMEVGNAVS